LRIIFTAENSSPKIRANYLIFEKMPNENNRPIGENSPNLVTLATKQLLDEMPATE
jgi:hypothetical protein